MKFHPPSRLPVFLLQSLPGRWFNVSERTSKRLLPGRFLSPDAPILEAFQSSVFAQESDMLTALPDEVAYVRLLKGAPLSVLIVLAIVDSRLKVQQLCVLTGYGLDEIIPALEMLSEYKFVERDNLHKGWVLSSMYALVLFEDERQQRRN